LGQPDLVASSDKGAETFNRHEGFQFADHGNSLIEIIVARHENYDLSINESMGKDGRISSRGHRP
jgi:hypothetical protein